MGKIKFHAVVCFKKTTDALRQGCAHEAYDMTSKKEEVFREGHSCILPHCKSLTVLRGDSGKISGDRKNGTCT